MSEFDKLKDDAEQYAQKHPEQVEKGEEAAEKKLGLPEQGQQQDQQQQGQGQPGGGAQDPGTGPGGADDSAGQGQ